MEPWQQWTTGILTFLAGLAAIWKTLSAINRKNLEAKRKDAASSAQLGHETQTDALKQCWDFARKREQWYDKEMREREERIKEMELAKQSLREEIHVIRNQWASEQVKSARLEEEVKYLRQELAEKGTGA